MLNGTFIQGFELDDYHSEAPLHSNSLLVPAVMGAAEVVMKEGEGKGKRVKVTGKEVLLAMMMGNEVGPRVGMAMWGEHMLTTGWHSGAVFGPAAAAAASSKVFGLGVGEVESALGIACTQAGGLMSAQFGSDVKRMQHGFAARNGLLGAVLARGGYRGIERVFEWEYGGFLACFSRGNRRVPQYKVGELVEGLGQEWEIEGIRVKAYAAMAGTHCTVDCVRELQGRYAEELGEKGRRVKSVKLELGEAMFHHGGWRAERPLTATGPQMSNAFVGATQLVHGQVLPPQFRDDVLGDEDVWAVIEKTTCVQNDGLGGKFATRVTLEVGGEDGEVKTLVSHLPGPRGIVPEFSNEEIVQKWRDLTAAIVSDVRRDAIEKVVLNLEECEDVGELIELLAAETRNPLA